MILGTSAICFSLSHSHNFPRNFNGNGNKTVNVVAKKQIDKSFPWYVLLLRMEMMSKCSKLST